MRALLALLVGAFGLGAWLRRRQRLQPRAYDFSPAEELRAKLAESRAAEPVVEEAPPEPVADEEPAGEPESPEDRRRRVHEEGRATLDEMHSDN